MTRGLDLNNPMNLMETQGIHWDGEIRPTTDPQRRLAQFTTREKGLHAGLKNLMNQQVIHGLNTWTSIITKYAPTFRTINGRPVFENNTEAYIRAMVKGTGIAANIPLDLTDPVLLETAGKCVIIHEQGYCPFTDNEIAAVVAEVVPPKPEV